MQQDIFDILKKQGFHHAHALGQNFIHDPAILADIADASPAAGGNILEIGAGAGTLTCELAKRAKKLVTLEVDKRLKPVLETVLSPFDNVTVRFEDIMRCDVEKLVAEEFGGEGFHVVANLPYYITTPVIMLLLEAPLPLLSMTVMIQKEVAERICAKTGSREAGAITYAVQYRMDAHMALEVGAENFSPPPKVDSAVAVMVRRDAPAVQVADEALFFRVVKALFAMRRKTLANNLCAAFNLKRDECVELLAKCDLPATVRGEQITMEQAGRLCDALHEYL